MQGAASTIDSSFKIRKRKKSYFDVKNYLRFCNCKFTLGIVVKMNAVAKRNL